MLKVHGYDSRTDPATSKLHERIVKLEPAQLYNSFVLGPGTLRMTVATQCPKIGFVIRSANGNRYDVIYIKWESDQTKFAMCAHIILHVQYPLHGPFLQLSPAICDFDVLGDSVLMVFQCQFHFVQVDICRLLPKMFGVTLADLLFYGTINWISFGLFWFFVFSYFGTSAVAVYEFYDSKGNIRPYTWMDTLYINLMLRPFVGAAKLGRIVDDLCSKVQMVDSARGLVVFRNSNGGGGGSGESGSVSTMVSDIMNDETFQNLLGTAISALTNDNKGGGGIHKRKNKKKQHHQQHHQHQHHQHHNSTASSSAIISAPNHDSDIDE